jgi:hypothetical protein
MLRRTFITEGEETRGGLRKLHNEELHSLISSKDIVGNIKSMKMSRPYRVVSVREVRNADRL